MRIRKRQVPLPLSSLSPVPLSDPHYFSPSPVVQLQLHNQPHGILSRLDAPPSDQPNQHIGGGGGGVNNRPDSPDDAAGGAQKKNKNDCMTLLSKEDERGREEEDRSHDFRKGSPSSGAYMATADLAQQSYSSAEAVAVGSWREGEKAFPLKKRRGSFDRPSTNGEETIMENNKKMKTKMKTKMINKKTCVKPSENAKEEEGQNDDQEEKKRKAGAKKRGRGGTGEIMEGSRCSRVNGRGWRCCQQTLVGYSLCEHHLGKGRLRSMNSVRSRSSATSTTTTTTTPPKNAVPTAPISEKEAHHEDDDEKKPLSMATKRRVKLGMVKARSISSLLGENNNNIAATSSTVADRDDTLKSEGTNI